MSDGCGTVAFFSTGDGISDGCKESVFVFVIFCAYRR